MAQLAALVTPEESRLGNCCHHWEIQAATGPTSPGICRNCGETREFKNYVEGSSWGEEKTSGQEKPSLSAKIAASTFEDENEEE